MRGEEKTKTPIFQFSHFWYWRDKFLHSAQNSILQQREQLKQLKDNKISQVDFHEKQIREHEEALKRHKEALTHLNN